MGKEVNFIKTIRRLRYTIMLLILAFNISNPNPTP